MFVKVRACKKRSEDLAHRLNNLARFRVEILENCARYSSTVVVGGARHAWDPPSTGWRSTRLRLRDFPCQTKGPAPLWRRRPEWRIRRHVAWRTRSHGTISPSVPFFYYLREINVTHRPQGYSSHLPHRLLPFCEKPSLNPVSAFTRATFKKKKKAFTRAPCNNLFVLRWLKHGWI
jgi:hypothetical protein